MPSITYARPLVYSAAAVLANHRLTIHTQNPLVVAAYTALVNIHSCLVDIAWVGADVAAGYAIAQSAGLHAGLMHSQDQAMVAKKSLLQYVGFTKDPAVAPAMVAAMYVTMATYPFTTHSQWAPLRHAGTFCIRTRWPRVLPGQRRPLPTSPFSLPFTPPCGAMLPSAHSWLPWGRACRYTRRCCWSLW